MSLWDWIYRRWFYGEDEPNTESCLDLNNNGICDYFEDNNDTYDWDDDYNWNTYEDET